MSNERWPDPEWQAAVHAAALRRYTSNGRLPPQWPIQPALGELLHRLYRLSGCGGGHVSLGPDDARNLLVALVSLPAAHGPSDRDANWYAWDDSFVDEDDEDDDAEESP